MVFTKSYDLAEISNIELSSAKRNFCKFSLAEKECPAVRKLSKTFIVSPFLLSKYAIDYVMNGE